MISLATYADQGSHQILVRPVSDTVYDLVLAAGVAGSITIPTGATRVILSYASNVFVKIGPAGTTATIPVASITNGTGSVINPPGFSLSGLNTTISCICPVATTVSMEFYS